MMGYGDMVLISLTPTARANIKVYGTKRAEEWTDENQEILNRLHMYFNCMYTNNLNLWHYNTMYKVNICLDYTQMSN